MDSNEIVPGSMEDRDITRFTAEPFPTIDEVLSAVNAEAEVEGLTPYRYEIGVLASREVTYKIGVKEYEETVSGVIAL
jgi:hypothetical protein